MPTGYTADVVDGKITELKDFALRCARGMGACITMRDDPWDAPIPENFEPHLSYYGPALEKARTELAKHLALPFHYYDETIEKEHQEELLRHNEYVARQAEQNARLHSMLAKVKNWDCRAEGIKEFMIQQLSISIEDYEHKAPVKMSPAEWALKKKEKLEWDIAYFEKQIAREFENTEGRNKWLKDLRDSL